MAGGGECTVPGGRKPPTAPLPSSLALAWQPPAHRTGRAYVSNNLRSQALPFLHLHSNQYPAVWLLPSRASPLWNTLLRPAGHSIRPPRTRPGLGPVSALAPCPHPAAAEPRHPKLASPRFAPLAPTASTAPLLAQGAEFPPMYVFNQAPICAQHTPCRQLDWRGWEGGRAARDGDRRQLRRAGVVFTAAALSLHVRTVCTVVLYLQQRFSLDLFTRLPFHPIHARSRTVPT